MKERTQPCTVQHIYKYVKIIDFYKTEFLNDSMLFTITQIEGNKDVLERSHYINWPGDTEADVSDKFSFPVLFSSLGTWYIFQINFHASFHEAVGKVSFFSLSRLKIFSLPIGYIEIMVYPFPPFISSLSPYFFHWWNNIPCPVCPL